MKRLLILVVMLVMFGCGSAVAQESYNAQGSAMAPCVQVYYQHADSYEFPCVILTNIASVAVECRVTFYDGDGHEIILPATTYADGLNVGISSEFEIPAKSTRARQINKPTSVISKSGFVVVEWKSAADPQLRKALIGGVRHHHLKRTKYATSHSTPIVLINNGQPF